MSLSGDEEYNNLKKARSTAKGQITAARNKLDLLLKKYTGQEFYHEAIKRLKVQETHAKLRSSWKQFQDLHYKGLEDREKRDMEDTDAKIMQDEEAYFKKTSSKV